MVVPEVALATMPRRLAASLGPTAMILPVGKDNGPQRHRSLDYAGPGSGGAVDHIDPP